MTSIPEFDNSTLLSALTSAGIIGGSLMLVDRAFTERSKWGVVGGVVLGVFLDYNLKKSTNDQTISFFSEYLDDLWNDVQRRKIERENLIREREKAFLSDLVHLSADEQKTKLCFQDVKSHPHSSTQCY